MPAPASPVTTPSPQPAPPLKWIPDIDGLAGKPLVTTQSKLQWKSILSLGIPVTRYNDRDEHAVKPGTNGFAFVPGGVDAAREAALKLAAKAPLAAYGVGTAQNGQAYLADLFRVPEPHDTGWVKNYDNEWLAPGHAERYRSEIVSHHPSLSHIVHKNSAKSTVTDLTAS